MITVSQISILKKRPTQEVYPQVDYGIVSLQRSNSARIRFVDHDRYVFVADDTIKLFCNNPYYGVLLVIESSTPIIKFALARGDAVVFGHRPGAPFIQAIGQNADVLFWWHNEDGLYPEYIKKHFRRTYADLRENRPDVFEREIAKVLSMNLDPQIDASSGAFTF
ncbi:hypothetical protein IKG29_00370 [Candidatus Saccharibacteria bacterium]|nr:hypothetical protein [Candidatus Saccharibacteria bacterium]